MDHPRRRLEVERGDGPQGPRPGRKEVRRGRDRRGGDLPARDEFAAVLAGRHEMGVQFEGVRDRQIGVQAELLLERCRVALVRGDRSAEVVDENLRRAAPFGVGQLRPVVGVEVAQEAVVGAVDPGGLESLSGAGQMPAQQ